MRLRISPRPLVRMAISAASRPSTRRLCPARPFTSTTRALESTTEAGKSPVEPTKAQKSINELALKVAESQRPSKKVLESDLLEPTVPSFPESSIFRAISNDVSQEDYEKGIEDARWWELARMKLDPAPRKRRAFERKMVIRSLQRRGRLPLDIKRARTERSFVYTSIELPASVKKLTKLMRQIAGMTVDEALVQLRFSKKRVATDVIKGLRAAREDAIAERGMGMGLKRLLPAEETKEMEVVPQTKEGKDEHAKSSKARENKPWEKELLHANPVFESLAAQARLEKQQRGIEIELKDGSFRKIVDPTDIYIDQAWVGKGGQEKSVEFRARGRVNQLTHRSTKFYVLLKEEKTRMRISEEIKNKRDNRKLWMPLPDRPITSQRQFCLW